MKIAFILFNGINWLDLVGMYEPVSRLRTMNYLPDLRWDFCGYTETVSDNGGLCMTSMKLKNDLSTYDAILVPGGPGTRALMNDSSFLDWLRTAAPVPWKISVCTGSLLLGAAGFLKGKRATTHFDALNTLAPFCSEASRNRIVADGQTITAGAVATSIDLGLYLCRLWAGDEADVMIRYRMDYTG